MSRTLRSPMVRGSTVLLGLGVLLWLVLRAPISAPHHGFQAYAHFQILARQESGPRSISSRNSDPISVPRSHDTSRSPALFAQARPRERQPPVLTLTEPAEEAIVTTPTIAVQGMVTDESGVTLRVQDHAVPGIAGAFTTDIRLQRKGLKGLS